MHFVKFILEDFNCSVGEYSNLSPIKAASLFIQSTEQSNNFPTKDRIWGREGDFFQPTLFFSVSGMFGRSMPIESGTTS